MDDEPRLPVLSEQWIGCRVTYDDGLKRERGIIKALGDNGHVFVVYSCGGDWDNYDNYTSALTRIVDLRIGWEYAPGD